MSFYSRHQVMPSWMFITSVPALITEQLTFSDKRYGAPLILCLTIKISGSTHYVIAVSINVSPFLIDEVATDIFITLAPNCFPANSNEVRVLVNFQNKLIIFLFEKNCFSYFFI